MRKAFLQICLLGLSISLTAQLTPCEEAEKEARRITQLGSIYFPWSFANRSLTFMKILEVEYGFEIKSYKAGLCVRWENEDECFDRVMMSEIENKWGRKFMKTQTRIANKLDKEGRGYYEPMENGIADSLKNLLFRDHWEEINHVNYLISLRMSPSKDILEFNVFKDLLFDSSKVSRESEHYKLIEEALLKTAPVYESARLRGEPIESTLFLNRNQ